MKSASTQSIVVLGEALVDEFPDRKVLGGAPFNVARNLAAFGANPVLITRLGQDDSAEKIRQECALFGLDTQGFQLDASHPTGTVKVHMSGTHHEFEILPNQAWDHLDAEQAVRTVVAARPGVIYFGTLCQRSDESRHAIRSALMATQAVRFLDLNLRAGSDNKTLSSESLSLADLVKVNDDELSLLLGWFIHPDAPQYPWGSPDQLQAIQQLLQRFALRRLIVTRGGDGWACFHPDGELLEGRSTAVTVKDTVGAGDAFSSVVLWGEVMQWPLAETLPRAAAFASEVCAIQGAVDSSQRLYKETLARWQQLD